MVTAQEEASSRIEHGPAARRSLRYRLVVLLLAVAALLGTALFSYWAGGGFDATDQGEGVAARVMGAWTTGNVAAIEDVYAPDVVLVLNGEYIANDRDELAATLSEAVNVVGNAYVQIGPVSSYEGSDGDLYVTGIVEVTGPGHPEGEPLVGFYRVRDGLVVRHVFWQMPPY